MVNKITIDEAVLKETLRNLEKVHGLSDKLNEIRLIRLTNGLDMTFRERKNILNYIESLYGRNNEVVIKLRECYHMWNKYDMAYSGLILSNFYEPGISREQAKHLVVTDLVK